MVSREKLRYLLQELFQLDQADLDFGIYRIMNTKRDEVLRFLCRTKVEMSSGWPR